MKIVSKLCICIIWLSLSACSTVSRDSDHELADSQSAPNTSGVFWVNKFVTEVRLQRYADAMKSVKLIAERWPADGKLIPGNAIYKMSDDLKKQFGNTSRLEFLDILSRTEWPERRFDGDVLWKEVIAYHLDNGRLNRALEVTGRLTLPMVLVQMRATKKYDAVVRARPAIFDVDRAMANHLVYLRARARNEPSSMANINVLLLALLQANANQEALAEASSTLERAKADPKFFADDDEEFRWVLNSKGAARIALGRPEGVEDVMAGARMQERGSSNVSQSINAASGYCYQGKPHEIHEAVRHIDSVHGVSPYGRIQLAAVELCAAVLEKNDKKVESNLAFLREHRREAPETFQNALVRAGRIDDAANWIKEALADPALRETVLQELQDFQQPTAGMPLLEIGNQKRKEIVSRLDVRAAIEAVGRIESYKLAPIY